jgi:MFS family permease
MIMMATGRFVGDKLAAKFSRKKMVQVSGILIFSGMMFAVLFPYLVTATIGFLVVGFGVSTIIPLLYSTVGKADLEVSKGIAIATVSSIGFLGFLMGPPLIGYISALSSLRYSYAIIGCFGLLISYLVTRIKAMH